MKSRVSVLMALSMLVLLMLGPIAPAAQAADITVTLAPGQEATIPLRLWCLDYGKPFPKALAAPGPRAPDGVIAVLQTAIAKGAVISDIYQTELAIWRVPTGKFNDFAKQGTTLAEQIYSDSTKLTVAPIPTGVLTVDKAIADGKLTYAIANFKPVTATLAPAVAAATPFFGTADLVVKNPTSAAVTFIFAEGTVFPPAGGENAQNLLSHQDPVKPASLPVQPSALPVTGAASPSILPWLGLAAGLLLTGLTLRRYVPTGR